MSVGLAYFRRFSDARRIELQYPARRIEFRTVSSYAFGTRTMHRQYSVPGCTIVLMQVHNRAGVCIYPQNGTAVTYGRYACTVRGRTQVCALRCAVITL
jgi:hypothetical protein